MDNQRVWKPLGEGSESRIVANPSGTAGEKTVSIQATDCEMTLEGARAFAAQILQAADGLEAGAAARSKGLFVKGAWIANPNALSDEEFYRYFCCDHGGLAHDFKQRLIWCQHTGKKLVDFGVLGPIPTPAWCPKRGVA